MPSSTSEAIIVIWDINGYQSKITLSPADAPMFYISPFSLQIKSTTSLELDLAFDTLSEIKVGKATFAFAHHKPVEIGEKLHDFFLHEKLKKYLSPAELISAS